MYWCVKLIHLFNNVMYYFLVCARNRYITLFDYSIVVLYVGLIMALGEVHSDILLDEPTLEPTRRNLPVVTGQWRWSNSLICIL